MVCPPTGLGDGLSSSSGSDSESDRSSPVDRAQSEVVGVILLTAVVVILMAAVGAFVLGGVSESASGYGPLFDAEVNLTASEVSVTHAGGDDVAIDELAVVLQEGPTSERYGFDAANVSGNGDADFEPTERFQREHGLGTGTIDVLVIHDPSNSVLAREHVATG
jgi:flagellin-like protein